MQLNNSIANASLSSHVKPSTSIDRKQVDARVKIDQNVTDDFYDSNKAPITKVERFDVDERALGVINQQQLFKEQTQSTSYDKPPQINSTAISSYQKVDNLAARDKIQQTFGIDLLA
tara:strand:+ start:897 stop:1247 length:351 start_codon:yes stop_codon:yes gene_type:complete